MPHPEPRLLSRPLHDAAGPAPFRPSEEAYRQLFEQAPLGYLVLTLGGDVIQANHAAGELLGLSREQLEGGPVSRWLHPRHHAGLEDLLQSIHTRQLPPGRTYSRELQLQRADGQPCLVQAQLVYGEVDEGQDRPSLLVSLSDITALRHAQGELAQLNRTLEARIARRTAEVREMAAEMEQLAQSVARDLNAPLRHIASFAGRLGEEVPLSSADRQRADRIEAAAAQMNRLTLSLERLPLACTSQLTLMPLDLNRVVDAVLRTMRLEQGLLGHLDISCAPLPTAVCDSQAMQTVLQELIGNAAKATQHTPQPQLHIGAQARPGEVTLTLRDNGLGFNPQYGTEMFEVFRKLHPQREFPGEGLGLTVARRLMLRQGGRLWAESGGAGQGACVSLSLPLTAPWSPELGRTGG